MRWIEFIADENDRVLLKATVDHLELKSRAQHHQLGSAFWKMLAERARLKLITLRNVPRGNESGIPME